MDANNSRGEGTGNSKVGNDEGANSGGEGLESWRIDNGG